MNLVIYTAIFGNFDKLRIPEVINKKIKYVCFSDKKINCDPWEIIVVKSEFKDPRRESRKYKILSHKYFPDFEYSIYIDGNSLIKCDLSRFIEEWLGNRDIAVKEHPAHSCLYTEAQICLNNKLDDRKLILKQIKKYQNEGYPKNNGLTDNSLIIRQHSKIIKQFNEMWWKEFSNYSRRDQLSFCYIINKLKIKCKIISNSKYYNCIEKKPHNKNKKYYYANLNELLLSFIVKVLLILFILRFFYKKNMVREFTNYFHEKKTHKYLSRKLNLPKLIKYFLNFVY